MADRPYRPVRLRVRSHGPELVHEKFPAERTASDLRVEHRPFGLDLDRDGRDQHDRQSEHEPHGSAGDIQDAFHEQGAPPDAKTFREDQIGRLDSLDEDLAGDALIEGNPFLDIDAPELELQEDVFR